MRIIKETVNVAGHVRQVEFRLEEANQQGTLFTTLVGSVMQYQSDGLVSRSFASFMALSRGVDLIAIKCVSEAMKEACEIGMEWNKDVGKVAKDVFLG